MEELRSVAEFLGDLICLMPPFHEIKMLEMPSWFPMTLCFGGVMLFASAAFGSALREMLGRSAMGYMVGTLLVLFLFAFTPWNAWKGVFLAGYPPLVMSLRFGEGALIGDAAYGKRAVWWLLPVMLVAAAIVVIFVRLPTPIVSCIKTVWCLVGATTASIKWTRWTADKSIADVLSGWLPRTGIIIVLFSTLLYVSSSPFDEFIYMAIFPVGFATGVILKRRVTNAQSRLP